MNGLEELPVIRVRALKLSVAEAPFEFTEACAQRHFVFDEREYGENRHGKAAAPAADTSIAVDGKVVPLTDAQWACIESRVAGVAGAPRRHSLRQLVEVMRLKLGTPYSWSKCPGDKSLVQSASVLLSKLQRAGVWERAVLTM